MKEFIDKNEKIVKVVLAIIWIGLFILAVIIFFWGLDWLCNNTGFCGGM